jgi:Recombination endonuclease VII
VPTSSQRQSLAKRRAARRKALLASHGITPEEYDAQLEAQGGCCAICGRKMGRVSFAFDHDHDHCERGCRECWRGLLCKRCNLYLLGWICQESKLGKDHAVMVLLRAIDYVRNGGVR